MTGPSELPPPFDPVDLHELIAQVICADAEVVPARLVSWMNRHVPDDRAAFVLLWSLTDIAAHMLHAQIGDLPAGACASVVFEDPDSPDGPGWPERIVGQLLSCAMNDDGETRSAVVVSVVSQGQRPVAQVVGQLIGLTRSMFAQQGGGG